MIFHMQTTILFSVISCMQILDSIILSKASNTHWENIQTHPQKYKCYFFYSFTRVTHFVNHSFRRIYISPQPGVLGMALYAHGFNLSCIQFGRSPIHYGSQVHSRALMTPSYSNSVQASDGPLSDSN